ncbi:hypothetical protein CDD82_2031 [Ophiocordyceps australis]|uniref:Hydrophobin n=1 Tax=Ophiocordyceps australis TaxID=1399860 RepID=A0A2C5ZDL4_9HYPO|nr:hypothetical protein CDD82_2031 [Ophiocordyceps australis]
MYAFKLFALALAAVTVSAVPADMKKHHDVPNTWNWAKKECSGSHNVSCCNKNDSDGGAGGIPIDLTLTCTNIPIGILAILLPPPSWCDTTVCCDTTQNGLSRLIHDLKVDMGLG